MEQEKIQVMENILNNNDRLAEKTKQTLTEKNVFTVNVMGAPGVGKTTTLIEIIQGLQGINTYVIEGDIESDLDTEKLKRLGISAVQLNTHGACHLDAPTLQQGIGELALEEGMLFVENIGNLVCPAEFEIGEHIKMLITSVTEGSDKPYKYPLAFEKADVIIVNKCDLMPYVDFDEAFFIKGIRVLNKVAPIMKVSGTLHEGYGEVIEWLISKKQEMKHE